MDTPTYNAEGQAIWKPQPGEYFPEGLRYVQSYGGVVSAIQDVLASQGASVKAYPKNFAGIISAIEDLVDIQGTENLPDVGAPPNGWEIIINPDGSTGGDWQKEPPDGSLWFDTRQGRLFIAIDDEFYQTNGADGIAHVGPDAPTNPPVIGQSWLDTDTGVLYVYIGSGTWQGVVSDGNITLTSDSLPLANAITGYSVPGADHEPESFEAPDTLVTQSELNEWLMKAVVLLDKSVAQSSVFVGPNPPTVNVVPGSLWYDSDTLELSVYYKDDNSEQWVPASLGQPIEEIVAPIQMALSQESATRIAQNADLRSYIDQNINQDSGLISSIQTAVTNLQGAVSSISIPDVTNFITSAALDPILNRVATLENADINLDGYATCDEVDALEQSLLDTINSKTHLELSDITPLIPDVSGFVKQSDITTAISNITTEYLPRAGGRLTGSFLIEKEDYSLPAFDFSSEPWTSRDVFKFRANNVGENYTKFGTTDHPWEYAWQFNSDEDFCWIYNDSNKVFSITKDGPACSTLLLGDIQSGSDNQRVITNKIDVKDRLEAYQTAFEAMRQGVSNASDFDSLKLNILVALANV